MYCSYWVVHNLYPFLEGISVYNKIIIDSRHEKTDLKVFVVVIPKKDGRDDTDFLSFESFDFIDHIL